jgi:hypothetical protein
MDYFKNLIDEVNYYGKIIITRTYNEDGTYMEYLNHFRQENRQETKTDIRSIQFMNSMIIVHKKRDIDF